MLPIRISETKMLLALLLFVACCPAWLVASQSSDSLQTHLGNGYEALKQEQYETAEKEFRAALAIDPSLSMRARFPLAVALFEEHAYPDSRQEFQAVLQAAGDQPDVFYYLGRIDLEERNYKGAIENLAKASVHPPFPDTAFFLGLAYVKDGSDSDAEKWLKQAIAVNPDDSRAQYQLATLYRKQGRMDEANQVFQQAKQAKARSDKQSQLKYECGQSLEHDSIEKAASVCDQLDDPNDVDKLTSLGVLYGQHGYLEQAIKPLQRAAQLAPQSPQMQYNLAFTYFQMKRFSDARGPLERAVQRWPDLFPLNALYGTVLWDLGEPLPAYQALRHAHELNRQDPNTTALLYQATMELANRAEAKNAHAEALPYLKEAATLVPKSPEPHQRMADIYKRTGQHDREYAEEKIAQQLGQQ